MHNTCTKNIYNAHPHLLLQIAHTSFTHTHTLPQAQTPVLEVETLKTIQTQITPNTLCKAQHSLEVDDEKGGLACPMPAELLSNA